MKVEVYRRGDKNISLPSVYTRVLKLKPKAGQTNNYEI
jgi:hypothetical protein